MIVLANKQRLDTLLVERQIFDSRERAKRFIMAGKVLVDDVRIDKAGTLVKIDSVIRLIGDDMPFVSRGGLKLQKAIDTFSIRLDGKITADIGASTGGFTDCMLQHGALKVYAIDVGYGQLAWKLRQDERVINMERTNIRNVTKSDIIDELNFASIDVAFISLELVLPVVFDLLSAEGEVVALIKPQFEAGREKVGKHGVVRDKDVHVEVINKVIVKAREIGFGIKNLTYSPIKGPEGNIEYLIYLTKDKDAECTIDMDVESIVQSAHNELSGR